MALCPGLSQVSQYQKKHSSTHQPDRHPIFISFFHLLRSINPVYTIQPVVQPGVSCIQTFNWLSNRFDNRLYRINGAIASSLFKLHAWQSFWTTSFHVLFGLSLGLEPSTSYSIHFFTQSVSFFATHAHTIATCFAVVPRLYHLLLEKFKTYSAISGQSLTTTTA